MGKKSKAEYNDFLDGEKLRDNTEVRTSLQGAPSLNGTISPPQMQRHGAPRRKKGKGVPKKPQLTHFLCIPLVNDHSRPQIESKLSQLQKELSDSGFLPVKAVRPPGTLHLTLGVMSLDDSQLELAIQHLAQLDVKKMLENVTAQCIAEQAAASGTVSENLNAFAMPDWEALSIDLKGLVPMREPQKTSILYAEPQDKTLRLQLLGEKLKAEFTEKGFLVPDKRTLRLHATIINTIYAKPKGRGGKPGVGSAPAKPVDGLAEEDFDDAASTASVNSTTSIHSAPTTAPPDPSTTETHIPKLDSIPSDGATGHGPNAKSWLRFDARDLMQRYEDVVWAAGVKIDRVQICRMGAQKVRDGKGEIVGEEYEVVGEKSVE